MIINNEARTDISPNLFVEFFDWYCKNHNEYDWNALWDMVFELKKDWMSIPRSVWNRFETDDENKNLVCDLFKNRPDTDSETFDRYVDNYWNLQWEEGQGRRSKAYKFMQNIFGSDNNGSDNKFYEFPEIDENFNKELDRLLN